MLRAELPARVSNLFEFGVALMLVGLGVRAIYWRRGRVRPARSARTITAASLHVHSGVTGAHSHRRVDAGAPAAARRRGARPGRQRRPDGARPHDAADNGGTSHLHGAVWTGIDAGDGRAFGPARMAAGARRQPPGGRARRVAGRRLRVDRCSASTTASLHRYCPTDRHRLRRITDSIVARLEVHRAGNRHASIPASPTCRAWRPGSAGTVSETPAPSRPRRSSCRLSDTSPCRTSPAACGSGLTVIAM